MTMPGRHDIYDVAIVGSGPTGGYAAKALSEAGLRVLVLEAGPGRRRRETLRQYDDVRRRLGYRVEHDPRAIIRQPVQSSCSSWPTDPHAFVDDVDHPYATEGERPFAWIRSRHVGGRMVVRGHARQFYRMSELDFTAGDRDGASAAWPISCADLEPYYERIERWIGVQGEPNGIAHLPDSIMAGAAQMSPGARRLEAAVARTWKDRRVIPGRTANNRMAIADALATRTCTLRSNAIVTRLLVDPNTANVCGVSFVDRLTRRSRDVRARVVVLCASSIESARLLLASATRQHPDGLANSSGTLGRYLMDHTLLTGMVATMPLRDDELSATATWAYVPRFRNVSTADRRFVRGYGIQVFTCWRTCALTAFGEMLPHADNRVTLDPNRTDTWGMPIARIACAHRDNELAMARDEVEACREMFRAAGFETTRTTSELCAPGLASHEVGTARMGGDSKSSVLNGFCQSWDARNLFVMDGSCFVSQGVQNPTLTMMAIAARSCDYLIDSIRRGDL